MKGLFSSTKRGAGGGINGGTEKRPLLAETCSGSGMITPGAKDGKSYGNKNNVSKREGDMGAGAVKKGGQNNKPNGKGEDGERALKDGADQQHQPRAESNRRSNWWVSSNDPSNNSSAGDTSNQEGGLHQNVNHEDSANGGDDDSCSTGTGGQGDQASGAKRMYLNNGGPRRSLHYYTRSSRALDYFVSFLPPFSHV